MPMGQIKGKWSNRVRRAVLAGSLVAAAAGAAVVLPTRNTEATVIEKGWYTYKSQLNICGIPQNGGCYVIVVLP